METWRRGAPTAQRCADKQTSELALGDHSGIEKIGTSPQYLGVFLKFGLFSTIHEGSLSTEEIFPNGAIASGKQRQCCSPSAFVWLQLHRASITVKTISMVGEWQRLSDTTIILYSWTGFYVVIAKGYSGGRSQAERRKKEKRDKGETREWDDGLIERIYISIFSEEVGGDRSPQERNERERGETKGDNGD